MCREAERRGVSGAPVQGLAVAALGASLIVIKSLPH
jgi:hypothetical protein